MRNREPLELNRREMVGALIGGAAISSVPNARAWAAAPDDYLELATMVRAVNAARGGTLRLQPGRTYRLQRHVAAGADPQLMFESCDGLSIEGNGATISVEGDFRRGAAGTRGLSGLRMQNCRNVTVRNLELDGNVDQTTRAKGLGEGATHGLDFRSCSDVLIENVYAHHFAADGLYIRDSARTNGAGRRLASRRFTVRNSRFRFNARQGLSVIQLRDALFEDCDFSYTGFIDDSGRTGPYGAHSPAAGVDVEPNGTPIHGDLMDVLTGEILFRRCRMVGNYGAAFLASKYARGHHFIERVRLERCHLECNQGESGGRDGFIFDAPGGEVTGCTLQMRDKCAYVGWHKESKADLRFVGNQVRGRNPGANRPFFALRPTARGTKLIENNRFVGDHVRPKQEAPAGTWLVFLDNPSAVVRANEFFVPAAAYADATGSDLMRAIYANAGRMETNTYRTDLRASAGSAGTAHFGVMYAAGCKARGEHFAGTAPGPADTIRPGDHQSQRIPPHDTRRQWSRG